MSRELRITLAILAVAAVLGAPLIFADTPPAGVQGNYTYMALALHLVPTPTPIPPPLSSLVLQPSDLRSGYDRDMNDEVTNTAAAATYPNPTAALRAFEAQGRETSWYVRYGTTQYFNVDALAISNQAFRFLSVDGATQGQAYILADVRRANPTFQPFDLGPVYGHPSIALRRTQVSNGTQLVFYYISVQIGRYITHVQLGGFADVVGKGHAYIHSLRAVIHIDPVPQRIEHDTPTETPGKHLIQDVRTVRDAITIH